MKSMGGNRWNSVGGNCRAHQVLFDLVDVNFNVWNTFTYIYKSTQFIKAHMDISLTKTVSFEIRVQHKGNS